MRFEFFLKPPPSEVLGSIAVGGKEVPLHFAPNPRARRYILRVRPDGSARVTIPLRGSFRAAREFVERHRAWLGEQLRRLDERPPRPAAWQIGSEIFFRGQLVKILPGVEAGCVTLADQIIRVRETGNDLRPPMERHMRALAARELPPRTMHFAQQHGVRATRVTVRDQQSRWGSCSRRGTISLNWRLIQAPDFVADYIILHELMHLRQMNHSPQFWREVETVCPDYRRAEQWLKAHGRTLK